ncbi:hypothetical protein pb186bvf_010832 [Paramecium bursaria]
MQNATIYNFLFYQLSRDAICIVYLSYIFDRVPQFIKNELRFELICRPFQNGTKVKLGWFAIQEIDPCDQMISNILSNFNFGGNLHSSPASKTCLIRMFSHLQCP